MLGTPTRMTLVTIGVIIFIAVAGTMAACGDGGTDTTASTSSSVSAGPTTDSTAAADAGGGTATTSDERVVVGGARRGRIHGADIRVGEGTRGGP